MSILTNINKYANVIYYEFEKNESFRMPIYNLIGRNTLNN
jgi:hypothetical protein